MEKKSQSAVEFLISVSSMLLIASIFFALTSTKMQEAEEEGNKKIAEDIANLAYNEIETAEPLNDGYFRAFAMPQTVNGVEYAISIVGNRELIVNYLGNEYVKFLPPNVVGNISKGLNDI